MDDPISKHGKFSWNELLTTDPEGAKEFYGQLFGWTTKDWPMDGFDYTIVKAGDTDVGGIMPIPPHATGMPPTWGAYVTVDDVDAAVAELRAKGAEIAIGPLTRDPGTRLAFIRGPDAVMVELVQQR